MYIIVFILGAMFGGTVGVFAMCLVQINRINNEGIPPHHEDHSSTDNS